MNVLHPTYRRLLGYAKPYRTRLAIGIFAGLLSGGSLFGVLHYLPRAIRVIDNPRVASHATVQETDPHEPPPVQTTNAVDQIAAKLNLRKTNPDGTMTWQLVVIFVMGLPLSAILKGIATFANHYYMRWVGARVVVDVRNELFASLENQSLIYFGKCDVGQLISRCTNDTSLIESGIANTIADLTRAPIEIVAALSFVIFFAVQNDLLLLFLGMLVIFPTCIIPIIVLGRYVKRYTYKALERVSDLVSRMQENLTGIRVVKAFHMEQEEISRFYAMNRQYFRSTIGAIRAELLMGPLMESVAIIFLCVFLVYCYITHVVLEEILTMGAASVLVYRPLKQLAKVNARIQQSLAAAERIFNVLDTDTALPEAEHPVKKSEFQEAITVEDLSFSYDEGGPVVLNDITLRVPRGSVVAFVGETGSGKTTIVNLVARFYDPTYGSILIDGVDLRDLEIASLRRLIGVVSQETILFNDTVARNIAYGTSGATFEDVVEAARKANAHEFIMADPMGYERVVGEKGFVLSGGQRQRIAIARAILKNPPILILDEATSALDTVTEQLVQEAISRLMEHRTVFAVAHRLSTVKHADLICVMDRGRIVERGTHSELYELGGMYRRLCDMQLS